MTKRESGEISEEVLCAEYNAVYRYVLSICRNESEAWDITQDTFLKAMKSYKSFQGESSLYTWLCAIAKRIWLNKLKKQKREVPNDELPEKENETNFAELSDEKEYAFYIHTILHKMKEPYKEVFSLRTFGELSFAEIGRLFSKSESWARVTYHRAKNIIIEDIRKDENYEQ